MNREEILVKLRERKEFCTQKFGMDDFALFGSFARDQQTETSDLDIVVTRGEKDYFRLIEMAQYLESELSIKVDIGFYDGMKSFFKRRISSEMIYV